MMDERSSPWHIGFGRLALFAAAFALLQLAWQALRGTRVEWIVVHDCTVGPAVALVNWLTPSVHARAVKFSMAASGGGINIVNGCDGTEVAFMMTAAFLVARGASIARLIGFLFGIIIVFLVNQVRILVLFYAYRAGGTWFDTLHGSVTPVAVILVVSFYFYGWLILSSSPGKATG